MKVCILGAGITGVTTAWFLAERGHDVTVVDREAKAASATSFANGCTLTPSHSKPWNDPSAPRQLLRALVSREPEFTIKWRTAGRELMSWGPRFLKACRRSVVDRNAVHGLNLALYSRALTLALADELALDSGAGPKNGALYAYDDDARFAADQHHADFLSRKGLNVEVLSGTECLFREPLLTRASAPPVGGIFVGDDVTMDCCAFTRELARVCAYELEVTFEFECEIKSLDAAGGRATVLKTSKGAITADVFVVCLGPWSGRFAATLGIDLPIYPARGYSMTVPVAQTEFAPRQALIDGENQALLTPLGDRLRVVAGVHFAGYETNWTRDDFRPHHATLDKFCIAPSDGQESAYWACLRAMTPDGLPVVSQAPRPANLWFNTGHCYLGWTWGMGTAAILASLLDGEKPDQDPAPFRYRW